MPPLGLYLHIPFCRSKCIYCDFYSLPRAEAQMDAYADALCAQLAEMAPRAADYTVDTVYFGGGTPSYLGAARLVRLLEAVQRLYRVDSTAEITAEANPDSAQDVSALRALRAAGFNRLSLGMQSADDAALHRIGRIHTHAQTVSAVAAARAAGFADLSLDLIYGLPDQTAAQWQASLDAALSLRPEHLSCYGLKVEPGTPLAAMQGRFTLPDDEQQADEYLRAVETLARAGYEQYEISNFARPGHASRHNLRYWTMGEYLGFGPGAHSDFAGRRFALSRDLAGYLARRWTLSEDTAPCARERREERVMLSLRLARGLDLAALGGDTARAEAALAQCARHGLAERSGARWRLTPQGFLVSNAIILRVLEALEEA